MFGTRRSLWPFIRHGKQIRIYHDGADSGHTSARTHTQSVTTITTRRMGHALGGVVRRAEIHAVHRLVLGRARRAGRGGRVAAALAAAGAAHQHLGGRRELDVGGRLARARHALDNDGRIFRNAVAVEHIACRVGTSAMERSNRETDTVAGSIFDASRDTVHGHMTSSYYAFARIVKDTQNATQQQEKRERERERETGRACREDFMLDV